jgi:hypothetical protein
MIMSMKALQHFSENYETFLKKKKVAITTVSNATQSISPCTTPPYAQPHTPEDESSYDSAENVSQYSGANTIELTGLLS